MMKLEHLQPKNFKKLQPFFKKQRYKLCAYSLPSLLVWSNDIFQPYGAADGDCLIVGSRFSRDDSRNCLLLPLSLSPEKTHTPRELKDIADSAAIPRYKFVPEEYFARFPREEVSRYFQIDELPEYEDYVYNTVDLANLKGNLYAKKRNLINQFQREYVARDRVSMEPMARESREECIEFLEEWCLERDCDRDPKTDLACEKQAAINAIEHLDELGMRGLLLRIDGTVCAFGIASHLTEEMGLFQFEKAFSDYKGLYQYFDRECARRLFSGYAHINKESDMGIPGLAKAKQSYFPAMRIKSYQLSLD